MKATWCTFTHRELSNGTKSVTKDNLPQDYLPQEDLNQINLVTSPREESRKRLIYLFRNKWKIPLQRIVSFVVKFCILLFSCF
jgi:hypothetical protein